MKTKIILLFLFIFCFAQAQLTTTGDDDIAVITFKDIPANTQIIFCDSEWNGTSFEAHEG